MISSPQLVQSIKFAAEPRDYIFDFSLVAVDPWSANSSVTANELRRPSTASESADGTDHSTGYIYQAGAAGQTGTDEPAWASTGTVQDGSIVWTPVVPPGASEDTIVSATWLQVDPPDDMLDISNEATGALTATATISGGTSGQTYLIEVTGVRKSGNGSTVQLYLTVL